MNRRQGLSAPVLDVQSAGAEAETTVMEAAWAALRRAVRSGEEEPIRLPLTHGFHAYPARISPTLVNELLDGMEMRPGARLHDGFCGGGTTGLCGLVRGMAVSGSDVSPVALMVARARSAALGPRDRSILLARAGEVASSAGRSARLPAPLYRTVREWYAPHILAELAGLRAGLVRSPAGHIRELLWACFSSILVKVSHQQSETVRRQRERRFARGYPTRLFKARVDHLVERLGELFELVPSSTASPLWDRRDARERPPARWGGVDVVISSPPYPATYDYAWNQELRLAWFGAAAEPLIESEIGPRKAFAPERYRRDLAQALRVLSEGLRGDGSILWLIGDGTLRMPGGGIRPVPVLPLLKQIAPRAGLQLVASSSGLRPDPAAGPQARRLEHLVWFRPD